MSSASRKSAKRSSFRACFSACVWSIPCGRSGMTLPLSIPGMLLSASTAAETSDPFWQGTLRRRKGRTCTPCRPSSASLSYGRTASRNGNLTSSSTASDRAQRCSSKTASGSWRLRFSADRRPCAASSPKRNGQAATFSSLLPCFQSVLAATEREDCVVYRLQESVSRLAERRLFNPYPPTRKDFYKPGRFGLHRRMSRDGMPLPNRSVSNPGSTGYAFYEPRVPGLFGRSPISPTPAAHAAPGCRRPWHPLPPAE
jgi:hypothetical protein